MKPLVVSYEAELDIADSFAWYYERNPQVAERFLASVREVAARIEAQPNQFPRIERGAQSARILRFPHSVIYRQLPEAVIVIACFHGSQDPKVWQRRAPP
jgi:plasmid stabilization system protein ParE